MIFKKKAFLLATTGSLLIFAFSCKHQIEDLGTGTGGGGTGGGTPIIPSCSTDTVYFQQQVLPILVSNCAVSGCHDQTTRLEGVVLTSYDSVMITGDIRPGRPGQSEVYERITDPDEDDRMPRRPRPRLSQEQIDLIRKWIEQGAKNNSCQSACDSVTVTYSGAIRNIINNKCQGCHSGPNPPRGINFTTYTGVKAKIDDGRLWGAVNHLPGFAPMPRNGTKLSDCELMQIKKWMDAGAPNN